MADHEPSRMRRLTEQYSAGEIDRETFIEEMTAFTWNPPGYILPPELHGATSSDQTRWLLNQITSPPVPDSIDELTYFLDIRLIDRQQKYDIAHARKEKLRRASE